MTGSPIGATITLADLELDPYPHLARLRTDEPVAFVPDLDMWLVTRWDDVQLVHDRPDLFTSATEPSWLNTVLGTNMLGSDGTEHRRLKDALQPSFTPTATGGWVTDVLPRICDELIGAFDPAGVDLMTAYAEPIAVRALQDALGWDNATWQQIGEWTRGVCTGLANFANDPELAAVAAHANEASGTSIRERVVPNLAHTGLAADEIVNNVRLCMSGGINEPRDGIALTVWTLLTHPDALAECRNDESLWRPACEELFRWISPVATSTRQATTDVEVAGTTIPAGALVAAVISSANRDERRWSHPDRFDLHRREGPHLAFSTGAHVCLGAWLGRSTVRVAVQHLFRRLPGLALSAPVEVRGFEFRGPLRLDVVW
ncbi:MAG: cytochrome P450 [Acidimicrobiales bacterium]|nr:cytochrome P450 [Acidimicrobiales bacterium]MCB9392380.1 cytochrome P450 [Acidimicrobiaceae bacterium]